MFGYIPRPRIVCKDGTSLSVQVGESLYCIPRNSEGPWTHVEVGFIRDEQENSLNAPESWKEYADTGELDSDVFGYVPFELVEEFIAAHGGRKFWS